MKTGCVDNDRLDPVTLIGVDFGSTTSSAMVATVAAGLNLATGRAASETAEIARRSDLVFTPFNNESIDQTRLSRFSVSVDLGKAVYIEKWAV